ncbi:hypothetical protein CKJ85_08410 [Corynebacterium sp. NML 150383]|uniref:SpaH/EbpB family LPXTG-anchored major pilin n=1 Tax=Corynebacterium sp. NML 150383 TaxID=2029400 RepID=UPI000BAA693A|nr:SpaH/EbpB family LPXTG-anchored major pilin [Corynebacterium sp. NML 150383]PAT03392.1 hypothetical protein CKJ85_08410 [Corynebacterium sp. NML 150383]
MAKAIAKTAAIAVAAGLTFAGSAGIATDAFAQETSTTVSNPAPTDSPAAETINDAVAADGTVNLTIHKRANLTGELQPANGAENAAPGGEALAGAKFSARKIKGDITDQRVFNQIAKLANDRDIAGITAEGGPGFDGEAIDLGETQGDGGTLTKQLRRGAYLITETNVPTSTDEAYIKSDPFIVFLPMTNANGIGWNTDVHLYPKNSMAKVTKEVTDADKHAGASDDKNKVVTYTLDGIVPVAPENNELTAFNINDSYNSAELQLDENFLQSVEVVRGETRTKLEPADYNVVKGKNNTTKSADGETARDYNAGFVISLTDEGLSKVQANDHVVATVNATLLNAQEGGDQDIWNSVNEAGTFKRKQGTGSGFDENPWETPHDEVVTYLGNIEVLKAGEQNDGSRKLLEGAEFKIGKCNADGTAIDGDPIQTGTTDKDGKLLFEGLHVTDVINNVEVGTPGKSPGKYCLQETSAPKGYSFDKNKVYPIELRKDTRNSTQPANFLKAGQTENSANYTAPENGTIRMNGVAINNVKSSTPTLPSTGGMGVLIIVLAGLAIIGGGVYAARRNSQAA